MLTLVFLTMATIGHGEGHEEHAHAEAHGPAEQHARTTAHS